MKPKNIIIAIDGTRYQIARFKLELASYLLGRIIRAVRVSAPAEHSDRPAPEPADPKDKPSSEDIARAMIGAGLFGDMDRASREEIQIECMKVCARIEGDLPMPLSNGRDLLIDDLGLVLRLEMETLVFNLSPFFSSGGLSNLAPQAAQSSPNN